jgi:hypothetical protein
MASEFQVEQLPPAAQRALAADAPPPLRMMAAKGILPGAKPGDLVSVVAILARHNDDEQVRATAQATLKKLPEPLLNGALSVDLQPAVLDVLCELFFDRAPVVEQLLRMPRLGEVALSTLAQHADEKIGELIATNETLLLTHPAVIEALYMNKRVRMSTADRILELAVRNQLNLNFPAYHEAAQAILNELVPEASDEETFDDVLFKQADAAAEVVLLADAVEDDTHDRDDDGNEQVREKFLPLYTTISQMTVTQKIRRAVLGTAAERMLLVRDSNRLVAAAAVSSPQTTENDAARIAACRNVSDDVLRILCQNRAFTRSYQVKLNLISNPKTPFTFSARMIPHLRDNDLRMLAKSKNIPATVQTAARQQLIRKAK